MKRTVFALVVFSFLACVIFLSLAIFVWQKDRQIETVDDLQRFIERGKKAHFFPEKIVRFDYMSPVRLSEISLDYRELIEWGPNAKCPDHRDEIIVANSAENQSVVCDSGDTAVLLGSGNDWLDDATGNDIILPGKGDDTIKSGWGSDIIVIEPNWGHDNITLESKEINREEVVGYDGSYPYRYTSFLVFGKGIKQSNLIWEGNTLRHTQTGDSITLNTKKINILFAENEGLRPDEQFIPEAQSPKEVSLADFNAESVTVLGDVGYFARGNDGFCIVNLRRIDQPLLLSQTMLPGRAMSVQVKDGIAFVAQGDPDLEGKRGWVSIVDVSNPGSPRLLKDLSFANIVHNVVVDKDRLYISESNFSDSRSELHIDDISDPAEPKRLSSTKIPCYAKFVAYLNDRVYLSDFHDAVLVYDVSDPKKIVNVGRFRQFKHGVWSVKALGGLIVVNQGDNLFSLIKPDVRRGINKVGDVVTSDQTDVAGLMEYDSLYVKDNYVFRAEGLAGVSITRVGEDGKFGIVRTIDFGGRFINSLFVVRDYLVAYDGHQKAILERIDDIFPQYADNEVASEETRAIEKGEPNEASQSSHGLSSEQLQTLLYQAAVENDVEQVAALCAAGADPNNAGHERVNPVEISARLGQTAALEELLRHGGDPNLNGGMSMVLAALREQFEAVKLLHKYGGNIAQAADEDGCTPLHYFAEDGSLEMVQFLVEKGAVLDAQCRRGQTPVKWAEQAGNAQVAKYLRKLQ